ncbi:MAG: RIP metalloprotease RseP [bacterium]|nr:RIP metalloprotease RseP [bacterium]
MLTNVLTSVPAFVFALGAIVFFHEFGHLLVAKLFGVRVVTFSLGFGKRLWGFAHQGTDYRISVVPLGGYVRLGGELPGEHSGDPREFLSKPRWQRILVYLAGPAMNVVLAVALIAFVFMHGVEMQAMQEIPSIVGFVDEDSSAEQAGLRPGDRIVRVAGKEVDKWKDVAFAFATSPERPVSVELVRDGRPLTTTVIPIKDPRYELGEAGVWPEVRARFSEILRNTPAARAGFRSGDELYGVDGLAIVDIRDFIDYIETHAGVEVRIRVQRRGEELVIPVVPEEIEGKVRIGVQLGSYRELPFGEAVIESVKFNVEIVRMSAVLIGKLFSREISARSTLSGPIEIAAISGRAARRGWKDLLYTMGFLSISIGLMNLLPIPVLDGGHISILVVESFMRRDLSVVIKERITQLGFMVLVTLMAVVIFFDLAKNLPSLISGGS